MGNWFVDRLKEAFGTPHFDYNVDVYTDRCIDLAFVEKLLAGRSDLVLRRAEDYHDYLHVQEKGSGGKLRPGLVIGPSSELVREFLPKSVANIIEPPVWQLFMYAMEGCHSSMARVMEVIYRAIADEGNGFVFHAQTQEIAYQSKTMRPASGQKSEPDVNEKPQLVIEWCIPSGKRIEDFMPAVMALWNEIEPRCLPVRYGVVEPFRYKFSLGSVEPFCQFVKKNTSGIVFWQSSLPVVGGHFSQASDDSKWKRLPSRYARYHKLSCYIHTSAFISEPELLKKIELLFQRTAMLLDAFFASVILVRYEPWSREKLPQHILDNYSLQYGPWWQGLPSLPVWQAWYGRRYFPYVKDALSSCVGASIVEGENIFLTLAEKPLSLDELHGIFPALPKELIVREVPQIVPAGAVASRVYESAEFIPSFDLEVGQ